MAWSFSPLVQSLILLLLWGPSTCWSQTYEDVQAIYEDKFKSGIYNPNVRPINNQSRLIYVGVAFQPVSIVNVDEVTQSFTTNGFLTLFWNDERLSWDPASYGQRNRIFPPLTDIWRPRVILVNTMQGRDIFQDFSSPLVLQADGKVFWSPGGLFPVSCALDLTKYPFDEQTCVIWLFSMNYGEGDLEFYTLLHFDNMDFFTPNGEWEYVGSEVTTEGYLVSYMRMPDIKISHKIRRRPTTLVLNIILPVVCLSLLNILVFAIPVESGEKISYGITVLLALSVFLSIVGSMLPRSADNLPYVTIYLSSQLVTSVINVILSIVVVFLHHRDGNDDMSTKVQYHSGTITNPWLLNILNNEFSRTTQSVSTQTPASLSSLNPVMSDSGLNVIEIKAETRHAQVHSYRQIAKYLNAISFVSALVLWAAMTAAFFIIVAT